MLESKNPYDSFNIHQNLIRIFLLIEFCKYLLFLKKSNNQNLIEDMGTCMNMLEAHFRLQIFLKGKFIRYFINKKYDKKLLSLKSLFL